MKKTKTSSHELTMKDILMEMEEIIDDSYLTTKDARKIMNSGYKLLMKCEELRKSRDSWRNKYEEKQ